MNSISFDMPCVMLLGGANHLESRFCSSKIGETGRGLANGKCLGWL